MGSVTYDVFRTALELVQSAEQLSEQNSEALVHCLERLETKVPRLSDAESGMALRSIISTLPKDGVPLAPEQVTALRYELEEIRIRMVVASASVGLLEAEAGNAADLERLILDAHGAVRPSVVHYDSGLSVTSIGERMILFLPRIEPGRTSLLNQTVRSLNQIVGDSPWKCVWILDFSSVRFANKELLAAVVGVSREISSRGGALYLCWFLEQLLSNGMRDNVMKTLDLVRVGNHLFSKALVTRSM